MAQQRPEPVTDLFDLRLPGRRGRPLQESAGQTAGHGIQLLEDGVVGLGQAKGLGHVRLPISGLGRSSRDRCGDAKAFVTIRSHWRAGPSSTRVYSAMSSVCTGHRRSALRTAVSNWCSNSSV